MTSHPPAPPNERISGSSSSSRQQPTTYCLPPPSWQAKINQDDARLCLFKMIAIQSCKYGFDSTTSSALHELCHLTERFLTGLFSATVHGAELSGRQVPNARDLIYSLQIQGISISELEVFLKQSQSQDRQQTLETVTIRDDIPTGPNHQMKNERYEWIDPVSCFLDSDSDQGSELDWWSMTSDSEGEHSNRKVAMETRIKKKRQKIEKAQAKMKKRQERFSQKKQGECRDVIALSAAENQWKKIASHVIPRHLPARPPRHCWSFTPSFPPNAYNTTSGSSSQSPLTLVNRKLANARLVESSLRRLIQTTDRASAFAYAASNATRDIPIPSSSSASSAALPPQPPPQPPPQQPPLLPSNRDSFPTATSFATPKPPTRVGSLTLRLKNKPTGVSLPSTPFKVPEGYPFAPNGRRMTLTTVDPPMTPTTPFTSTPFTSTPTTPYPPPTPSFSGQYFGSQLSGTSLNWPPFSTEPSSSNQVQRQPYDTDILTRELQMQIRVPGAVNYKNVWYAPGSTIQSGGSTSSSEKKPHLDVKTTKRMRRWKV